MKLWGVPLRRKYSTTRTASVVIVEEVDGENFDKVLDLIADKDVVRDRDRIVPGLVVPGNLGPHLEDKRHTGLERLGQVTLFVSLLGLENSDRCIIDDLDTVVWLFEHFGCILKFAELATTEERRGSLDNRLAVALHKSLDFDSLSSVGIGDRDDVSLSLTHVATLEEYSTPNKSKTVG
jgi:hypothetical protein